MSRCEYIYDFDRERASWSREKQEWYDASTDPEQYRRHALLKGARCTASHHQTTESCSQPDCASAEHFNSSRCHVFTVGEKSFLMSEGITCWDCFRPDCGYTP